MIHFKQLFCSLRCQGVFLIILTLASPAMGEESADVLERAWELNTRLLYSDSRDLLAAKRETLDGAAREADFSLAITLLNTQPKTQRNIDEAERLLRSVAKEDGMDDRGLEARYYLGRIAQVHRSPPNMREAARIYRAVFDDAPDRAEGQRAGLRWMVLYAFEFTGPEEKVMRLKELDGYEESLTDPVIRRDYHILMANAYQRFASEDVRGLDHLESAIELGLVRPQTQADFLVRAAETARAFGRTDTAVRYYRLFTESFSRDNRNYLARQRLKELEEGRP